MVLRTSLVAQPHLYMGDTQGRPLDAGKVYFGEPNKDPELYPINVYYDEALTIAAPQPIRTMGGFMNASGQMVEIYAAETEYSVKVLDGYGRQVFYQTEMSSTSTSASVSTKLPYPNAVNRTQASKNSDVVNIKDFGAVGNNISDDTQAFKDALFSVKDMASATITLNAGDTYKVTDKLLSNQSNLTIAGNGAKVVWAGAVGGTLYDGVFEFTGELTNVSTTVSTSAPIDSSFIKVVDTTGLAPNDYIWCKSSTETVKPHRFIQQLFRITNIDPLSKTILLDTPIGIAFDISTHSISVTKVNTVHNSHIVDVEFEAFNQTSREFGISAVQFIYASACTSRIESKGFWFKGVSSHYTSGCISSVNCSLPAATGGGEGYGLQFEYSTNCLGLQSNGHGLRHLADATASFGVTFNDMRDSGSLASSFNLHNMGEHNVVMNNCHSNGSAQYGFGIGSYGTGVIGQWSGHVTLNNCTSEGSVSVAAKATSAQGNYTFNDCKFSTLSGNNEAYSLVVSNADVAINNCNLPSGLYVLTAPEVKKDGYVRVSGGSINRNVGFTKTLQMGEGTRLDISNCELENYWSLLGACDLRIGSNSHVTATTDHFVTSNMKTHNISISNSKITLSGPANMSYIMYGNTVDLNNVEFIATNNTGMRIYSINTTVANCRGSLRLQSYATSVLSYECNVFRCIGFNNVLAAYDNTGTTSIVGNKITSDTSNAIAVNNSNTSSVLRYSDNTVIGGVSISAVASKGIIKDNTTTGTATFPTASSTMIVANNL